MRLCPQFLYSLEEHWLDSNQRQDHRFTGEIPLPHYANSIHLMSISLTISKNVKPISRLDLRNILILDLNVKNFFAYYLKKYRRKKVSDRLCNLHRCLIREQPVKQLTSDNVQKLTYAQTTMCNKIGLTHASIKRFKRQFNVS